MSGLFLSFQREMSCLLTCPPPQTEISQKEGGLVMPDNICSTGGSQTRMSIYSLNGWTLVLGLHQWQGIRDQNTCPLISKHFTIPHYFSRQNLPMKLLMISKDNWIIFENEIASFWIQKLFRYKVFFTSFITFLESLGHFTLAQSQINALFSNSILVFSQWKFTSASPWKS